MLATIHEAEKFGLGYDVVDDLTGSNWDAPRARPSARRMWWLDTMAHVIKTMQDTLTADIDPFAKYFTTPPVLKGLVEKGALGQKAGARLLSQGRQGHQGARTRSAANTSRAAARPTSWWCGS